MLFEPQSSPGRRTVVRPFLRASCLLLAAALLGGCEHFAPDPPPPAQIAAEEANVVDDREIVALARTASAADALVHEAALRGFALRQRQPLEGLGLHLMVFQVPEAYSAQAAIRLLESLEPGVSAGVNHGYRLSQGAGGGGRVYADAMVGWPAGGCASAFPTLGIIDAAVDPAEPGLSGADVAVKAFTRTAEPSAASGHATVTALVIAGPGRLRGARILNAAVVADHRQMREAASVDGLLGGLDWLQRSGVRLVNISLEGPYNKILDRGVQQALAKGMILVASVGNGGPASPPRYPAAFDGVIGVTALDAAQRIYAQAPHGGQVDFAAPGVDVYVPLAPRGRYVSGTSVAAPQLTALIAASAGARTTVRAVVEDRARAALDLGARGPDPVFGRGLSRLPGRCASAT